MTSKQPNHSRFPGNRKWEWTAPFSETSIYPDMVSIEVVNKMPRSGLMEMDYAADSITLEDGGTDSTNKVPWGSFIFHLIHISFLVSIIMSSVKVTPKRLNDSVI